MNIEERFGFRKLQHNWLYITDSHGQTTKRRIYQDDRSGKMFVTFNGELISRESIENKYHYQTEVL